MFGKDTSLWTMQWCGSILFQVHSVVYVVCSTWWDCQYLFLTIKNYHKPEAGQVLKEILGHEKEAVTGKSDTLDSYFKILIIRY